MIIVLLVLFTIVCVGCLMFCRVLWNSLDNSWLGIWMTAMLWKSVAEDIVNAFQTSEPDPMVFPGEVVIVTGGTQGLGLETVKKLLHNGVFVIIGCRRVDDDLKMFENLNISGLSAVSFKCYQLDLTSRSSIKNFADTVLQNHPLIHVLVNNAEITNRSRKLTEDGVENTFCVNYLGHFYLSHLLLERLAHSARTRGRNTRIVNVSSRVHRYPLIGSMHLEDLTLKDNYDECLAYGQSKLALVMFTQTLGTKMKASLLPVHGHVVDPGIVFTPFLSTTVFSTFAPSLLSRVLRTPAEGARSVYFTCFSPKLELQGGTHICGCKVVPARSTSSDKRTRDKLWTKSMDMLNIEKFGGKLT